MLVLLSLVFHTARACAMYAVTDVDTDSVVWMGTNLYWSLTPGAPGGARVPGYQEVSRVSFVTPMDACATHATVVSAGVTFYGTDYAGTGWETAVTADFWSFSLRTLYGWANPVSPAELVGDEWMREYGGFYTADSSNEIGVSGSLSSPFVLRVFSDTTGASASSNDEIQVCVDTVTFSDGVDTVKKAMATGPVCGNVLLF